MFTYITRKKENFIFLYGARVLVFILSFSLIFAPSAGYAQALNLLNLPVPGTMVTPSTAFVPVLLKGMTLHPENPLQFDFIVDSGNTDFKEDQIKEESERLVKYFLASMTIPKDDLWVNLSPYESDKIIPDELGKTELGRDMLAQDYILKQLTASLMYPEKELGKEFWNKVYQKAQEKYGTTEIPVDTFNKVWILPETATVYEHGQTVYIVDAKLKVMLDSDYVAMNQGIGDRGQGLANELNPKPQPPNPQVSTEIIREVILPEIEREVNEGQNFAPLRQIYHSLILAKWYKETIKNSLLSKIYVDQRKTAGVESGDETLKDQIYAQYMEAYKKGVFNYIKEDYDRLSQETIPRKYFSGGITGDVKIAKSRSPVNESHNPQYRTRVEIAPQRQGASSPMDRREFLKKTGKVLGLAAVAIISPSVIRAEEKSAFDQFGFTEAQKKFLLSDASRRQKIFNDLLWIHIRDGDMTYAEWYLKLGADSNARSTTEETSVTPLIASVQNNDVEMVKLLIKYGADVNGYGWRKITWLKSDPWFWEPELDYVVINPLTEAPEYEGPKTRAIHQLLLSRGAKLPSRVDKFLAYNELSFVPETIAVGTGLGLIVGLFAAWRQYTVGGNIRRLQSGDWETRRDAVKKLTKYGNTRAVIPFIERLGDKDSDVRKAVTEALTVLGASRDQMVLGYIAALESNDSGAKLDAIDGLKGLGDARGIEPLLKLLGHGNRDVHQKTREALTVLGAGRDQMVAGYIAALESDSYEVRRYAVEALKGFSDSRAIEPLLKRLGDSDSGVRKKTDETLRVLGASQDQMVLGYLAALKSNDSGVQMNAVGALKGLGDPHAIGPLEALLLSKPKTIEVDYGYEDYSGPYGELSGWVSDWRTENNPEYFAIENALQKLRSKAGGAVSSPLESGALNRDFVKKMIMDKKINLADIKDARLKKFLQFLKQNNLTDVVVMGGAIKSILFNEDVADIDISLKMALAEEERTLFAPLTAAGNERVYQRAAESIGQLAEMLGVKAADFLPPSRGARKAFEGLDIDYFGPIKTERGVVIKRSIFDAATKQGYFTNTAAGLLRFGIDAEGNIYGDVGVLRELLQGNLTIEGDGSNFGINSILRVLRLKYQYGLRISDQDYQLMRNDLTRRRKHPLPPVVLEVARDQVKKLLANTQDSEAAQQELETLGISALVSQSSSPITGEKLNQVKEILSMFGINEIENANELDGGVGSQDKPIHVFSPQEEMVLRKSRYKEPQLKFIVSIMNRLKSKGIPVPTLYYREGGDVLQSESYIADYQGSRYTLEEYLTTGKNVPLEDVSRDQFIEIAQLAAKINNALSGFQPQGNKRFKSRTEIAGDLQNSFAEYKKIVESLPVDKRQEGHILFRRYSDFFMNQLEIFRQEYDADAQKTSITHSDLHPGNIKFDGMGKIVGLIDFDFTITDHRVIEFNNLILGKDDVAKDLPYSRDKMLDMVSAYNRAVNDKLNDAEIKAIIEVIRLRFLEEIHSRFVRENFYIPTNIFEHPDQLPFAYTSISLFKQFAEDFSTDKKIQAFVDEVNESRTIPDLYVQSSSPAITPMEEGRWTMEERSVATNDELGGIDLNAIDLDREGTGVDIQFDPAELQELIDAGIDGFAPVIINITPLPSVLPLLGLEPRKEEYAEELSLLD